MVVQPPDHKRQARERSVAGRCVAQRDAHTCIPCESAHIDRTTSLGESCDIEQNSKRRRAVERLSTRCQDNDESQIMANFSFRPIAFACFALGTGFAASSALAQERFAAPYGGDAVSARPYTGDRAAAVPQNVTGQFTCGYNETHTRLERMNCGGVHYGF